MGSTTSNSREPQVLPLPRGCINASALRSLAMALDRLAAFHKERGGPSPDSPCLTEVHVVGRDVMARVVLGEFMYWLLLVKGAWEFR